MVALHEKTSIARVGDGNFICNGQEGCMLKLYGLRACDTCRKAVKALTAAGHDVTLIDLRDTPPDPATLARFEGRFGADLVNRRSTTWRGLPPGAQDMATVALIAAHPAVMKRPVIDGDDRLTLGWDAGVRATFGL
jgi:arsenate reductase-like glutaredoxin family protein